MTIFVQYIDSLSSNQHRVVKLDISKSGEVKVTGWGLNFVTQVSTLTFSQRIGDLPRKIIFQNGAIGYSSDNDKIDKLLEEYSSKFSVNKLFIYFYNFIYYIIMSGAMLAIFYGIKLI